MEACVLGRIKSDGYRFLARIYGLIWESVQKTKSIELSADDKGYIAYFLKHLNQYELLKRKRQKLYCLVMGYLENVKRHFKRPAFKLSYEEPNWQKNALYDEDIAVYRERLLQSENGEELLIEKAGLAKEVKKLILYYNHIFYAEACPERTLYLYKDMTSALLQSPNQEELKDRFINHTKYFHYSPMFAEDADNFIYMNDKIKQAIITHVPQSIICKIMDKNEPYVPPVMFGREKEQNKGENGNNCHSEGAKRCEESHVSDKESMLRGVQHDNHCENDAELTSPPAGEVGLQSKSGEGDSFHNKKDDIAVKSPLTLIPLPRGERDSAPEERGIPDELIHNLGNVSMTEPTILSQELAEYYALSKKIKKGDAYINKALDTNQPVPNLVLYVLKLKLRREFIKRRMLIQHNHEIKQDTEGIG